MLKAKTIQSNLFFSYSTLIACIVFVFIMSYNKYTSYTIEKNSSESIQQVSNYISSQLDSMLENMDRISMEVLFSDSIQDNFFQDISSADSSAFLYNQRELYKILYSILGPWIPPVRQINLFNLSGRFIGIGSSSASYTFPASKMDETPWIKHVLTENGKKFIILPHKDDWGSQNATVISLARVFSNTYELNKLAVVEVQQNYDVISDIIFKSIGQGISDKKVYVFDADGKIVYPYESSDNNLVGIYWNAIKDSGNTSIIKVIENPYAHNKEILTYTCSDYSKWTVALVESEKQLLQPVISFRNKLFFLGILVLFLTLLVSLLVAKGLTRPIKQIHKSLKALNLETLTPLVQPKYHSGFNELEELNMSFHDMCERLKLSLAEVVSTRSHEIQARMLALQSKMNPHFLYNTITTISIIAEQNRQDDIVKICEDLSAMLRYILSDKSSNLTLNDEIDYTVSYLNLMKKRYGEYLNYQLNMPACMMDINLPKLIIQPLVENCIKHGINVSPPWTITIEGSLNKEIWQVSVRDNGIGFSESKLTSIKNILLNTDISKPIASSNLDGIGLANIYARLKLLYGENAIFRVSNHPDGGAVIVIGGTSIRGDAAHE